MNTPSSGSIKRKSRSKLAVNVPCSRLIQRFFSARASKVLREQHAARDTDRYERPQVIIVDRAAGGDQEVKEEEWQVAASASARSRRSCTIFRRAPFTSTRRDSHLPEAYTLQSPARGDKHFKGSLPIFNINMRSFMNMLIVRISLVIRKYYMDVSLTTNTPSSGKQVST